MNTPFWNKEVETMDRSSLQALQLDRLRCTVASAFHTAFYRRRLERAGIAGPDDIRTLDDLRRIPFTTKDDLRENYPNGLLAVGADEVVRIHTSSGTTGTPTVIHHTREDIACWANLMARCMAATGASRRDVFQNMTSYGMFTGGLGMHYGAELLGMTVIPVGSGNTRRQIQLMRDFHTTVAHMTPSYALHVHSMFAEMELKPGDLALRRAFLGAEPYSENTRLKIEQMYGIDAFNSYGLSEMNGPGVAFECVHKNGMHLWEDAYLLEIIDPRTGQALPDGHEGELVLTTLCRQATPLLRYRVRDLTSVIEGPCPCGRTHRRISRITGRCDDMLIVNGANVFPSQIEEVIMRVPEVGTNYLIQLEKDGALDRLIVKVEIYPKMFTGDPRALEALKARIKEQLKASIIINPTIELHEPGSLPVSEGKAKRVVDNREKL
jgi:phenylacetate-CoA ligase